MHVLRVALPLPLEAMSYLPPHGAETEEAVGRRVVVPWRNELRVGLVIGAEEEAGHTFHLRSAVAYLDKSSWVTPAGVEFLLAATAEVFAPVGILLSDLIPFLEPELVHRVRLLPGAQKSVVPKGLSSLDDWQEAAGLDPKALDQLREAGVLEEEVNEKKPLRKALVPVKAPDQELSPKARAGLEALYSLGEAASMAELARYAEVGTAVIKRLVEKGYIGLEERALEAPRPTGQAIEPIFLPEPPPRINGGRLQERLRLLAGLVQNKAALVLFPEVSLLNSYLKSFPGAEPFHGEMPPELRRQQFSKHHQLVFATYQGLMLPFAPERIVIVEDAADAYKLAAGSRAHAVRLIELRARMLGVPTTYLSLVPSVETITLKGYTAKAPTPRIHTIDLNTESGWPFTGQAVSLLRQVEEHGRQAVVLVSRRGYSAVLRCKSCQWKAMCPNCSLPLRFHRYGRAGGLLCHQCGHREEAPDLCPDCGSDVFEPKGPGVEWLEEALARQLPGIKQYRYTADDKDNIEPLLLGEPGVLLGTTAILRAPVLPELALVLLPYADGFVLQADYRAAERYHRMLWQLAELHPRRRPLLALQTYEPKQFAHRMLEKGDLEGFVITEHALRSSLHYPPAVRMLKIEISHAKEPVAREAAMRLAEALGPRASADELLGPAPAPVPRIKGQYVFHLLLRASTPRLSALVHNLPSPKGARMRIDPDPQSFVGLLED
ncbi:MAG: hypothetical protein M1369_04780 [Deinococcus sp.]|nr:primosomal protein N' [Acidobacteriota bacterium]MCL5965084.1 hypothetical protein [Deinococcus sp.]